MPAVRWSSARIASFLQIHAFLKDPIGGLRNDFATQTELFALMINNLKPELDAMSLNSTTWDDITVQLALESSFKSQPLIRRASHIYFSGDQQLVYSYAHIDQLAHSEFACPSTVVGMIQDLFNSTSEECEIAPIIVAPCHPICSGHDARAVILDGNNRITTVTFLNFVSTYSVPEARDMNSLREHCRDHTLGPIFSVDICAVLKLLWNDRRDVIGQL